MVRDVAFTVLFLRVRNFYDAFQELFVQEKLIRQVAFSVCFFASWKRRMHVAYWSVVVQSVVIT